jgi:N-acetylmuramoyl-L-alanine amidase CwlA
VNIKTHLADKRNYGGKRSLSNIKYLVMHYTANDGDSAINNCKYFANNYVSASAHYFVDGDGVMQSVPDDYNAYHCGASHYKHPTCRNSNSIGIELCDELRNGVYYPTPDTIANALELAKYLMDKYNISKDCVIRHYDVTGKKCPAYWCGDAEKDALWKTEFWNKLGGSEIVEKPKDETAPSKPETPVKDESKQLYRIQLGAFSVKKNATAKCDAVKSAGFDAFVVQIGALWKVQCGCFAVRANADAMVRKLQGAGFLALVVPSSGNTPTETISVGSTVKVKKGAKSYDGVSLANFIYNRVHDVKTISGDRVVIAYNGITVAAVHKDNLMIV